MPYREFHYCWKYDLKSGPEQLWSFVADTNRFNRDTGVPSVQDERGTRQRLRNARRRLRLSFLGLPVEWEEQPFEWVRPSRFGVTRTYTRGPVAELKVLAELTPQTGGGTRLSYQVWARPKSLLGFIVVPLQLGLISARKFARASDDTINQPSTKYHFSLTSRDRSFLLTRAVVSRRSRTDCCQKESMPVSLTG